MLEFYKYIKAFVCISIFWNGFCSVLIGEPMPAIQETSSTLSVPLESDKSSGLPKKDVDTDTLKVLMVGSSWGVDTIARFSEVAYASGISNIVGDLYHSGVTFRQHIKYAQDESPEYTYMKWVDGEKVQVEDEQTLNRALEDQDWDVVIIMQGAYQSGIWSTYQPYMNDFIRWIKEHAKNPDLVIALNATWAKASWSTDWMCYPTQEDMVEKSRLAYLNAMKESGIEVVIPSGAAIANARQSDLSSTANTKDLSRDGIHLDIGIGHYVTACAVFESICEPMFGISILGNPFRDLKDTSINTPINDQNAIIAQECAIAACRNWGASGELSN